MSTTRGRQRGRRRNRPLRCEASTRMREWMCYRNHLVRRRGSAHGTSGRCPFHITKFSPGRSCWARESYSCPEYLMEIMAPHCICHHWFQHWQVPYSAPSHCLDQWWPWNSLHWNLNQNMIVTSRKMNLATFVWVSMSYFIDPWENWMNFELSHFNLIFVFDGWGMFCEIVLRWLSLDFTGDESTLGQHVRVMAWRYQAINHHLSQCWPSSMWPYGVTRPQWAIWFKACSIQLFHILSLWPTQNSWTILISYAIQHL